MNENQPKQQEHDHRHVLVSHRLRCPDCRRRHRWHRRHRPRRLWLYLSGTRENVLHRRILMDQSQIELEAADVNHVSCRRTPIIKLSKVGTRPQESRCVEDNNCAQLDTESDRFLARSKVCCTQLFRLLPMHHIRRSYGHGIAIANGRVNSQGIWHAQGT